MDVRVVETRLAFSSSRLWRAVNWRLLGRRPPNLNHYNRLVCETIEEFRPDVLLTTGVSPVSADTLKFARSVGVATANYPTDDPWNPGHRSNRYFRSVPCYDVIFSPRRANLDDFRLIGARRVEFLPFAYDSVLAHPVNVPFDFNRPDLLFVGGGDPDRYALLRPVVDAGISLTICGNYWQQDRRLRKVCRGQVGTDELCLLTAAARVCLCLVRRANRDEHVMRSYEIPAIGGCVLAEDTRDHRELYGDSAAYFRTTDELIARARELIADDARRAKMAAMAHARVVGGANTYADRLQSILAALGIERWSQMHVSTLPRPKRGQG